MNFSANPITGKGRKKVIKGKHKETKMWYKN